MAALSGIGRMGKCSLLLPMLVASLQHGVTPPGISIVKEQKADVLEPESFSFEDLLHGKAMPDGMQSWTKVFESLGRGDRLPAQQLKQMMDASGMSGLLTSAYIDPELRSELGNQSVKKGIANITGNTELLMKAVQQDPMVQQLAAVSPDMAQVINSPDALKKIFSPQILDSVRSGQMPDEASMEAILELASGKHVQKVAVPTASPASSVLDGGLRLKQVRAGDGKTFPTQGDTVSVYYAGYLTDGKLFDHGSYSFVLGSSQVIPGWEVALKHMSLGQRAVVQVPAELGYGASGEGPVPPNSDLLFDVDLRAINKLQAPVLTVK
ncbi:FKBP1A [Symbiodinium sp. CCMP2592]|nr:FKBP1A [Symbiodinium sp. CCMP2592]